MTVTTMPKKKKQKRKPKTRLSRKAALKGGAAFRADMVPKPTRNPYYAGRLEPVVKNPNMPRKNKQ